MCERNLISIREQRNLYSLYFCIPGEVNSSCVRGGWQGAQSDALPRCKSQRGEDLPFLREKL